MTYQFFFWIFFPLKEMETYMQKHIYQNVHLHGFVNSPKLEATQMSTPPKVLSILLVSSLLLHII